jgi:hypothetical protein
MKNAATKQAAPSLHSIQNLRVSDKPAQIRSRYAARPVIVACAVSTRPEDGSAFHLSCNSRLITCQDGVLTVAAREIFILVLWFEFLFSRQIKCAAVSIKKFLSRELLSLVTQIQNRQTLSFRKP